MGWVPWRGAEYEGDFPSLGWGLVELIERYLLVPSGPMTGEPIRLSDAQVERLVRFYAVDEVTGRAFKRRAATLQLPKGTGKSPEAASWAVCELVGPVVPDGWDARGEPVGRPRKAPWVQIAAAAEDQTENTYSALYHMLAGSDLLAECGVDLGLTRIHLVGRPGRLEAVTSSAGTREGQPLTFAVLDETHLWTPHNGGRKLAATLRRNLAKMGGRWVETTNAYEPGLGSVAEETARAAANPASRMLWVGVEAPPVVDPKDEAELRPALAEVYRDCPWVDLDSIVAHCVAEDTDPIEVRRFFLNQVVASEARLVGDELLAERTVLVELEDRAPVALGFDGSVRRDATALVAVHMVTGVAYLLGLWERPSHLPAARWEVPGEQVHDTVLAAFDRFDVARFKADPSWWREELAAWQATYGRDRVDRFPVNHYSVVDEAVEATQGAFQQGSLRVDGSQDSEGLRRHLAAAQVAYKPFGSRRIRSLVKPEDGRRIDAAAALVYAQQARLEALRAGWEPSVVGGTSLW